MKVLVYLFVFVLILGVVGFGFFTMSSPNIMQTSVSRTIDPNNAFASAPQAPAPADVPSDVAPAAP